MAARIIPTLTTNDIARLNIKIQKLGPSECWPWTAGRFYGGYGAFYLKGVTHQASRVVWFLEHGVFDFSLFVCHDCDNPCCCNPGHLFLGTALDNMRDKVQKGRQSKGDTHGMRLHPECMNPPVGERSATSKLKEYQVKAIRELHTEGYSQAVIAALYGVQSHCISRIVNRLRWKHI